MFSAHHPEALLPTYQAPPHLHAGQGHNHGHNHRGNGSSGGVHLSTYIKKNYVFILVACLVAVHTILFSTTTLLKSLPDGHVSAHVAIHQQVKLPGTLSSSFSGGARGCSSSSSRSKKGGGKSGSSGTGRRLANARKKGTEAARRKLSRNCNVSAAPYELRISNGQSFPRLESFVRTNLLLLEDVGPSSHFKMNRQLAAAANVTGGGNKTAAGAGARSGSGAGSGGGGGNMGVDPGELDSLMFGFDAGSPLLPLPRGLLPLFSRGPHDTACAMEQVTGGRRRNHCNGMRGPGGLELPGGAEWAHREVNAGSPSNARSNRGCNLTGAHVPAVRFRSRPPCRSVTADPSAVGRRPQRQRQLPQRPARPARPRGRRGELAGP